jgi:hypothetical protein
MFLAWDGIATVVKAVSAVMIAEVLLAFFFKVIRRCPPCYL